MSRALAMLRAAGLQVDLESEKDEEFFVIYPRSLFTEQLRELVKTRHQEIWNALQREQRDRLQGESP